MIRRLTLVAAQVIAASAATGVLVMPAPVHAQAQGVVEVEVEGQRLVLSDVLKSPPDELADTDLGPSPAPGGSRLITRDEVVEMVRLKQAGLETPVTVNLASLPEALRVRRAMETLTASRIQNIATKAVNAQMRYRGTTLAMVKPPKKLDVAAGWTGVQADVPKPPRKKGRHRTNVRLTFLRNNEMVGQALVPIELDLTDEAALPDVSRGAAVNIVVRRGLVEIRTTAFAQTDADTGEIFPVQLRPSGKVLKVMLGSNGEAEVISDGAGLAARSSAAPFSPHRPLNGGY